MGHKTGKEQSFNHETLPQLTHDPAPINLHLYQPPRVLNVSYKNRSYSIFNISGISDSYPGFNHTITSESYQPLIQKGMLGNDQISWNLYGVTADWLTVHRPELVHTLQQQIQGGSRPPVGDTYLHAILPFLSSNHKHMLLSISREVYKERWGVNMESVWLPESAVDSDTLAVLRKNNISAVYLREHQLSANTGSSIYQLNTDYGKILAVTGHNHLSGIVGFAKPWSDTYYQEWLETSHRLGYSPRISIDGETLGHWWKEREGAFEFTKHLLGHLSNSRLNFSIPKDIPPASLHENTSWSCLDNGLGRWSGSDDCSCDLPNNYEQARRVRESKSDLFRKLTLANTLIDYELDNYLSDWRELYVAWFLSQRQNLATGLPIDATVFSDKRLEKLFLSAYIRDLGWTSCGWFFGDVGGFERQIPANSLSAIAQIMSLPELSPAS